VPTAKRSLRVMNGETEDLQTALLAYKAEVYHPARMTAARDPDE
jgi:hypothetical protein